jgi:hypothetical protein
LLASRVFSRRDFFETREGVCRVLPPLTHALAETSLHWATLIAPHAEGLVRSLLHLRLPDAIALHDEGSGRRSQKMQVAQTPTPLTQANRRRGGQPKTTSSSPCANSVTARCIVCGSAVPDMDRQYCDECYATRRAEIEATFAPTGRTALARLRAAGQDPAHGGGAGKQRGRKNAQHVAAMSAWQHERNGESITLDDFTNEILPRLQSVSLLDLMAAT